MQLVLHILHIVPQVNLSPSDTRPSSLCGIDFDEMICGLGICQDLCKVREGVSVCELLIAPQVRACETWMSTRSGKDDGINGRGVRGLLVLKVEYRPSLM